MRKGEMEGGGMGMKGEVKGGGKVWMKILGEGRVREKALGVGMGSGKGGVEKWVGYE
ncbi:hypothetical protein [Corynebacterium glyciniphilum]|uniref:hypothetical protein n=1 Tax=Corynebacterium glyciniphilum TaxID=1404244 RepID=UPI0011AB7E76